MRSGPANGQSRLHYWLRIREVAVSPLMISTATTRREIGDWSGACSAAHVDVDLNLRSLARTHGRACAAAVRADLRHLAPDLLRWHLPRISPDGQLRPGLTISLARYHPGDPGAPLHLVVRTPPVWAAATQRISLALWHRESGPPQPAHPHPAPDRRFRLDLHRHLWDARRFAELRERAGADDWLDDTGDDAGGRHRWTAEAQLLLHADGRCGRQVVVRLGARRQVVLTVPIPAPADAKDTPGQRLPVLPDAATWVLPDLELLRAGLIDVHRLHPLVGAALVPASRTGKAAGAGDPRAASDPLAAAEPVLAEKRSAETYLVACGEHHHRIGRVNGVFRPLDHDAAELRREHLLTALGGPPLPCLRLIDQLDLQARTVAEQRLRYGIYRSGLTRLGPRSFVPENSARSHPHGDAA